MDETPTIVVLDGHTLNPGDLSWKGLESLGSCLVYDRTPPELTVDRAQDADIVLTNKTVLDGDVIGRLPALRCIGVMATGYNVVDLDAAAGRNIPVTNVPEYATRSVVQLVFGLLIELAHRAAYHGGTVREGRWAASEDFCYWDGPLVELHGRTMGILGYGRIGRAVAEVARAFGMNVLVADIRPVDEPDLRLVAVDALFSESDVVSLHCPLTPETEGVVNADSLSLMKSSAFLLNTGRGPLVVEADLAHALNTGGIAGAGLDVLSTEPPMPDNPLLSAKNCLITPHIAWATLSARKRLMETVVGNVAAFLRGEPENVVNGVEID